MNILFVVPSYKPAYVYGGPTVVIPLLAETLVRLGHRVTVYTTTANGRTELDVPPGEEVLVDGVRVIYFPRLTGDHTHVSPALWRHLGATVRKFDVVHLHSWWNLLVMGAAWVCQRRGVTPVLSPHGMFSDYILTANNSGKKKWLHQLLGRRLLGGTRLHVSTALEWEESRRVVPGWPGAVIPNPVVLPQGRPAPARPARPVFTIGFLSRIDPKKGLDILIQALGQVDFAYRLLIAGDGEPAYVQSLRALAGRVGNADCLEWVGWQQGEAKFDFLAGLDLFALTSHSENFAVVVIEALSVGTPVLVSNQVGLHSYVAQHAYGWVTALDLAAVTEQLNASARAHAQRARIAATAPAAIRAEYEDAHLARQYEDLYRSLAVAC